MAVQFFNPFAQFLNSAGAVLAGAQLFAYQAGAGNNKLDTYPTLGDAIAGTNPNSNPIILDSAGKLPNTVFLKDQRYKFILAPATDTDPPTSPIWTSDDYHPSNFTIFPVFTPHDGNPNGSVAGTAGSAGVLPSMVWDYTNKLFYVCTTTGNAATAVWISINASAATAVNIAPQGYLTLLSGTPVITTNQAAATTVFYTPDVGNLVPIFNGASFTPTVFAELSCGLVASHALNTIYDFFVFSNAGVPTLVTGPAWTNSGAGTGARGTGASTTELTRINGYLVNAVLMTGRNGATTFPIGANLATYVGSILIDGTNGQVTTNIGFGQSRIWGLWNAYNRKPITLIAGDATASWTHATGVYRASNNDAANSVKIFSGLAEERFDALFHQNFQGVTNPISDGRIAIGHDSTTAASGKVSQYTSSLSGSFTQAQTASYQAIPQIGISVISCLEFGGDTSLNFKGGNDDMQLAVSWRG